jgi:hypothetical protein
VLSTSFDANPGGAHPEIGKRTYFTAWWMSTNGPNDPSSILCVFFFLLFVLVKFNSILDMTNCWHPQVKLKRAGRNFTCTPTGLEPRTFFVVTAS